MPLITYRSALVGRCAFNLVLVGLPVNINEDNNFRAYSYLLHNKNYQLPRFQKNWGPLITHGLFMGYELPMVMDYERSISFQFGSGKKIWVILDGLQGLDFERANAKTVDIAELK